MKKKQPLYITPEETKFLYDAFEALLEKVYKDKEAVRPFIYKAEEIGLLGVSGEEYEKSIPVRIMKDKMIEFFDKQDQKVRDFRNKLFKYFNDIS